MNVIIKLKDRVPIHTLPDNIKKLYADTGLELDLDPENIQFEGIYKDGVLKVFDNITQEWVMLPKNLFGAKPKTENKTNLEVVAEETTTGSVGGSFETPLFVSKKDLNQLEQFKKNPKDAMRESDEIKRAKKELLKEYVYPSNAAKGTAKNTKTTTKREAVTTTPPTKGEVQKSGWVDAPKVDQTKAKATQSNNNKDQTAPKREAVTTTPPTKGEAQKNGLSNAPKVDQTKAKATQSNSNKDQAAPKRESKVKDAPVKGEPQKSGWTKSTKTSLPTTTEANKPKIDKGKEETKRVDTSFHTNAKRKDNPPKNVSMEHRNKIFAEFINSTGLQHYEYDDAPEEVLQKFEKYLKAGDNSKDGLASNPNSKVGERLLNGAKKLKEEEQTKPEVVSLGDDIELTGKTVAKDRKRVSDANGTVAETEKPEKKEAGKTAKEPKKKKLEEQYDGTYFYNDKDEFVVFKDSVIGFDPNEKVLAPYNFLTENIVTAKIVKNGLTKKFSFRNAIKTINENKQKNNTNITMKQINFKTLVFESTNHAITNIPQKYENQNVDLNLIDAQGNSVLVECRDGKINVLSTFSKKVDLMSEQIEKFSATSSKKTYVNEDHFFRGMHTDIRNDYNMGSNMDGHREPIKEEDRMDGDSNLSNGFTIKSGEVPSDGNIGTQNTPITTTPNSTQELAQELNDDRSRTVDQKLEYANEQLEGYGVESVRDSKCWSPFYLDICTLYVNMGDSYSETIVYDVENDEFVATSWGDWTESHNTQDPQMTEQKKK